jgi:hypothetical protein
MASWHLQGCSPHLCRFRIDGLDPMSKYGRYWSHAGDMGLVSLVAFHQQVLGLGTLLQWLCWERNWGRSSWPPSRVQRWCREHFFSQKQCIRPTLLTTRERLVYADHARYVWSRVIHRPSVECVWHVDQVSRVGCTSIWIVATLGYK